VVGSSGTFRLRPSLGNYLFIRRVVHVKLLAKVHPETPDDALAAMAEMSASYSFESLTSGLLAKLLPALSWV
jgi:hypothetical protein